MRCSAAVLLACAAAGLCSCTGAATGAPDPDDARLAAADAPQKQKGEDKVPSAENLSDAAKTPAKAAEAEKAAETMPEGCVRELLTVPSPSMKRDIRVAVTVPPCYATDADARYPVLYALHGMGASYKVFSDMSPLRKFMVDHPMILVGFDADRASCYVDSTEKPDSQFTTFFFDELLPYVAALYRTNGQRALTGFSMGGYGSLHYLLTRPDAFTSASSLSGAFYLFHAQPGKAPRHADLLGDPEANAEAYARCDIPLRLKKFVADGVKLPPIMLACGTEDRLIAQNRALVKLLTDQNHEVINTRIKPQLEDITDYHERRSKFERLKAEMIISFAYLETPGGHDWPYWKGTSEEIARFHWKHFQAATK